MSILDTINANTEQVRNGKNNVASAIASKGGSVISSGIVPTFNELVAGVNSIDTSGGGGSGGNTEPEVIIKTVYSAGNGAVEKSARALGDIDVNDSVVVLKNVTGNVGSVGENIVPNTGRVDTTNTDGTISTTNHTLAYNYCTDAPWFSGVVYHEAAAPHGFYNSPTHKFICVGGANEVDYYFPFYLSGGTYQQVKIDGQYNKFDNVVTGSYFASAAMYDEDTQLFYLKGTGSNLYVYKFNSANLNLTKIATLSVSTDGLAYACNSHLIYNYNYSLYIRKFNETTASFDAAQTLFTRNGFYNGARKFIRLPDETLYILIGARAQATTPSVSMLSYDSAAGTYTPKNTANGSGVGASCNWADMPDTSRLFEVHSSDKSFHSYKLYLSGTSTIYINGTEEDYSSLFLDDVSVFDPSKITGFICDRSGYMLAILGATNEWYLLYTDYDDLGNMLGYRVVADLKTDFTPTPAVYFMGYAPTIDFGNGYFLSDTDPFTYAENVYLYNGYRAGGDYLVQKTNNRLSSNSNVYGYGIATEAIASGEEGTVSIGLFK